LTVPPRMFLLSNPVRFISNKQLKLFKIPETLKHMKRELKPEEHEEIVNAVAAGDRIKAKNIYLSATEGNLTDAQNYLRTLSAKAEVTESERLVEKPG
jgi:DNA-binding GntR family transcriptional regulator